MRHRDGSVQFSERGAAALQDLHVLAPTWTTTFPPSCAKSTRSTTWTASTPMAGRRSAACPIATARSAASCRRPARPPTGAPSTIACSSCGRSTTPSPKRKSRTASSSPTLGGNVRGGPNLDRLGKIAAWFQADNQGRTYEDPAVWGCSLQGRVCNAVMDGKFAANVTAAYSTGVVALAQCFQESRRSQHVAQRNAGQRHGALLPLRRRGGGLRRRPPLAEGRRATISAGPQSTMRTSRLAAPSPTSAW